MSAFVSAGVSMHLRSGNRPMDWHLSPCNEFVQIHGTLCPDASPASDARVGFIGDPAEILRELDVARQLVIDHLVATVGVPATMVVERKLLADTLHEGWDTLPSPITHRLKSVLAGDQPTPTGRTAAAALTERTTPDEDALTVECLTCHGAGYLTEQHDYASEQLGCQDCEGAGRIAAWLADPCPADPDGQHFVGCGCDAAYADRSPVAAGGAS